MSENCDFDNHIATVVKKCSRLCGWILQTFSTRSNFQASLVNFI